MYVCSLLNVSDETSTMNTSISIDYDARGFWCFKNCKTSTMTINERKYAFYVYLQLILNVDYIKL